VRSHQVLKRKNDREVVGKAEGGGEVAVVEGRVPARPEELATIAGDVFAPEERVGGIAAVDTLPVRQYPIFGFLDYGRGTATDWVDRKESERALEDF
jgi:hypothetical protein